jgi:hypothetical protein
MNEKRLLSIIIVAGSIGLALLVFLAPIIPLGSYGVHYPDSRSPSYYRLPNQIFIHTGCYDTGCPIPTLEGQSYVSISYWVSGIGEYLFLNEHVNYIWAFVW